MPKMWKVVYEHGPYQCDEVHLVSDDLKEAKVLIEEYLTKLGLWHRVGFGNVSFEPHTGAIPIYREILMTDYFIHNTVNFFMNGDADIFDLLTMVEKYNNDTLDQQKLILIGLNALFYTEEFKKLSYIPDQTRCWNDVLTIINKWEIAWFSFIDEYPHNMDLCTNQTILNYKKIVS